MPRKKKERNIDFHFQINFVGTGKAYDEEDIIKLIKAEIRKMKKSDIISATDFYFVNPADGKLTRKWLDGRLVDSK